MRRIAVILVLVAVAATVLVAGAAAGDESSDGYRVRAIFDNGAFLVPGEDVRIVGATVGHVDSVDVTGEDESAHEDGSPDPGKAAVVMEIDDAGFQDFRQDASCLIRPQSLLGEKYVDCRTTRPRAAGTAPPPELEVIGEGEPGEGERFLPLEQTGKAVDLDLVNNIMQEPYAERFRLILNDLGAGLAARGEELGSIVERANPALRETDRVLATLARQNRTLANLARDGDRIMGPLARDRSHLSAFINNADVTAQATAERNPDLEAGLQKLPTFLRELRVTMGQLRAFADAATPTVSDLGDAAPGLTRATVALGPFAAAGIPALTTLGDAAEEAGPDLVASDPLINDLGRLGDATTPAAKSLARLLASLESTGGFRRLLEFVYYSVGSTNGFDQFGHLLRAVLVPNSCTHYSELPSTAACGAHFEGSTPVEQSAAASARRPGRDGKSSNELRDVLDALTTDAVGVGVGSGTADETTIEPAPDPSGESSAAPGDVFEPGGTTEPKAWGGSQRDRKPSMSSARLLMKYFLGDQR